LHDEADDKSLSTIEHFSSVIYKVIAKGVTTYIIIIIIIISHLYSAYCRKKNTGASKN